MNVRENMHEYDKARCFWDSLDDSARHQLGDDLVLGEFDWRDWLQSKPSHAFLRELDYLRILWESSQ